MQLYFVRHGQSANNLLYELEESSANRVDDPELTEYGRKQVPLVGKFLANGNGRKPATRDAESQNVSGFHLTHLYASPMVRAMDTARAIAKTTGLTPVVWQDIHETGGIWLRNPETEEREGKPGPDRAYFEERYPEFVLPNNNWGVGGWWGDMPYEPFSLCFERAKRFLAELEVRHGETEDRVAVVSHGGFYNAMIKALFNIPFETGHWFTLHNVGVTRIEFSDETRLSYSNRVDFLPPELVT